MRLYSVVVGLTLCLITVPGWANKAPDAAKRAKAASTERSSAQPKAKVAKAATREVSQRKPAKALEARKLREASGPRAKSTAGTAAKLRTNAAPVAAVQSEGSLAGLHATADPLALKSGVALVIDSDSQQVLLSKNPQAVLPIASITKLMTALVVVEAGQSMDELIQIEAIDADETMNRRSRLTAGTSLPRSEMLRLALMSSENRAAFALSRHFPGGVEAFVQAMNRKAASLGMSDTRFVEATGLSSDNRSSAVDLARLVTAASEHAVIREYSTSQESLVAVGTREKVTQFRSTNGLIYNTDWDITLQKTGYIAAAGRCLVMQASLAGRRLTMILLDSAGKYSRLGDAERIRQWLLKEGAAIGAAVSVSTKGVEAAVH